MRRLEPNIIRYIGSILLTAMYIWPCAAQDIQQPTLKQDSQPEHNQAYSSVSNYWTLFKGEHIDYPIGLSVGYVNKYWRTDFGNKVRHENIWGQLNKRIHGVQFGVFVQPCFNFGLGLHSGLFAEYYFSVASSVKDMGYDNFSEWGVYLPLHGMYRIPLSENAAIYLFSGLGFNLAISGTYNNYEDVRYYDLDSHQYEYDHQLVTADRLHYGESDWPKRFNSQFEIGTSIRLHGAQFTFLYSRGLTNHNFYQGYKTTQDKIEITIGIAIAK